MAWVAATVRAYVKAGADVIGMDIDDETGNSVCLGAEGSGSARYMHADVSDLESIQTAFGVSCWSFRWIGCLGESGGYPSCCCDR